MSIHSQREEERWEISEYDGLRTLELGQSHRLFRFRHAMEKEPGEMAYFHAVRVEELAVGRQRCSGDSGEG